MTSTVTPAGGWGRLLSPRASALNRIVDFSKELKERGLELLIQSCEIPHCGKMGLLTAALPQAAAVLSGRERQAAPPSPSLAGSSPPPPPSPLPSPEEAPPQG